MSATFTVNVDIAEIEHAYDEGNLKRAQTLFARRVGDDSNRYCKWDTGDTHDSMVPNSDFEEGEIRWTTAYASEAYNDPAIGEHPSRPRETEPHWKWFEYAKGAHLPQWTRLAKELLSR